MRKEGDHVHLEFEDIIVDVDSDDYHRAVVDLGGVRCVTRDHQAVDTLCLEREGSGVLAFERHGQTATLVVVWHSYSTRTDETRRYSFVFGTFEMKGEKQPGYP